MTDLRPFAAQGRFIFNQGKRWHRDLDDSHLALAPTPSGKTAGWLLGHLSVTGDFGRKLCGLSPMCTKEWRTMFNPGTQPSLDAATYPSLEDLRATLKAVYVDLYANGPAGPAEQLGRPNPYAPAIEAFPTAGDFACYLMTGHLAHHLGQLTAWRVAAGMTIAADAS